MSSTIKTADDTMLTTLYKLDTKNKMRLWSIELRNDGLYRTITGLVDGKKVTSEWTTPIATNVGRSNQRAVDKQGFFEVSSIIDEKLHEGYHDSEHSANTIEKSFECMLAKVYEDWYDLKCNYVYSQPKLDGIRCLASKSGLLSRNDKPILAVPHIEIALNSFFINYPHIILDGELYNHKLKDDFNKITSLVRKTKNIKDEDFDASKNYIQYHIYDVYSTSHEMTFEERLGFMEMLSSSLLSTCLVVVNTHKAESDDMLMELYQEYLSDGYEGQMIRIPNSKYDQKRSKNLLKRKPFHESGGVEDEYKIVDILEGNGNWSNKAKSIMCLTKDNKPFRATIKGNMEFAENVWKERDKYIGTWATVMCQNLTPDGIPRFPIAKDIGREDI